MWCRRCSTPGIELGTIMRKKNSLDRERVLKNATEKVNQENSFENRMSRHLLFNALNSAVALCRKDPEAAAELLIEISSYLQRSLVNTAPLIPLEEELEHVFSYIYIQKVRFPHRLEVVLDIETDLSCLIPAFTLQPIVDNAIRHGLLKRKQGGTVSLSIHSVPRAVQVCIKDDGAGMSAEQLASLFNDGNQHRSLYRVHHALQTAGFSGLDIRSQCNEGTRVAFDLPFSP